MTTTAPRTEMWTVNVPPGRPVTGLDPHHNTVTVDPVSITFTSRPSGTVYAIARASDGTITRVTVSYLDGGWFQRYPIAPGWVIDLWMETS